MEMPALNRCEALDLIPEINRQSRSVRRRHHHDSFGVEELYRSAVEEWLSKFEQVELEKI
jgi:hypothetical protein